MKTLLQNNPALETIFYADSSNKINFISSLNENRSAADQKISALKTVLGENKQIIERLFNYKSANFTKIEPVSSSDTAKEILIFILDNKHIGGFIIDKNMFVMRNLSSVIQSIAKDEFAVSVFNSKSLQNVYSTEQTDVNQFQQKKPLWLIPDYSLGIILKGRTVESLVKERIYKNLIMIILLTVLMVVIAWIGYKNVRREVELAQIKSDFVSNVSHELRTPLSLINMFAETLSMRRVKTEEKKQEYYEIIQHETERLSKIVNKILSFSKIESGNWKFQPVKINLNALMERIYGDYKFHLQKNGFEFVFEPSDSNIEADLDSEAVSEAVVNLIDNSAKYSSEKKKITLRTGGDENHVFIEVEDNGIGIAREDREKIFEKFFRVSGNNIYNAKGTGLGLALVKQIVEAHHGEIKLKSELGKGSVFKLIFPITQK